MVTQWEPEYEADESQPFTEADWDTMTIAERAERAKLSGREGKLGSKLWYELTPDERASIIDPEKRPVKLEYQVKAHVALENSDKEDWGMVKYIEKGVYTLEATEGELVGSWSRSPTDGLVHVSLETPLAALADKATQDFAKLAIRRQEQAASATATSKVSKSRSPKAPKVTKAALEPNEDEKTINRLRSLFGK